MNYENINVISESEPGYGAMILVAFVMFSILALVLYGLWKSAGFGNKGFDKKAHWEKIVYLSIVLSL